MEKKISYIKKESAVVWIQCTRNNTLLTLTDTNGNTLAWSSSGVCGLKNSRKSTTYGAEVAAINMSEKIYNKGFSSICVYMKGTGRGKKKALSALSRTGLFLEKITDYYKIPFNGCRPKKKRKT